MLYMKANHLDFSYENQPETLLEHISFELTNHTRVGLIGKNGCGKSTLFQLLKQKRQPSGGTLTYHHDVQLGVLDQEMELPNAVSVSQFFWSVHPQLLQLKQQMDRLGQLSEAEVISTISAFDEWGGYELENQMEIILSQMGLAPDLLQQPIGQLSGGEKTRIALCRILLQRPNFLLLDEPTNHLDQHALTWLENYLITCDLPFVIISHDRAFLDRCVHEIWALEAKTLVSYSGNYSAYKAQKNEALQRKMHQYDHQQRKINQLKHTLSQRKNWAFTHQKETGSNGNAPTYKCVTNYAKSAMKRAKNVETRLQHEIKKAEANKPWIEKKRTISLADSDLRSRIILSVDQLGKSFDKQRVFENLSFSVANKTRLAIVGSNGSGKSTLLKLLQGLIADYEGNFSWSPQVRIGYYAQEFEHLDPTQTIIDEVTQKDYTLQTQARTVLGCFDIRKDDVFQRIKQLSLGERSKVALAKIIVSRANTLILDEPNNHLEIEAREALEDALLDYDGTIIMVSHDRYFLEKIARDYLDMDAY